MTKRPFTSRIEVFDVVAICFLFFVEIGLVFSVPHRGYKIEKNEKHSKPKKKGTRGRIDKESIT